MQLRKINIETVLFLDIETVPQVYEYTNLDAKTAELYDAKTKFLQKDGLTAAEIIKSGNLASLVNCLHFGGDSS